ncbi:DUF1353 domain-containing protein [uncultured Aureimonas sp.]|uniref:DUF1353 domain-containing protein n=1 Tax=uncultured Aureimonas sp. TaxID=1604662 RepID=UPI0025FFFAD0|nr:DUF1353 domain-containing protein [uncultured Aureimonas sp.]
MSAYTDFDGTFTRVPGTDRYTASKPLAWDIGKAGSGKTIEVPALYEHDVSIPGFLTWIFDRHDPRFQRAARLHDWLLDNGWSAWTSAAVFYDALKADRVPRAKRWAMAIAVLQHVALKGEPQTPIEPASRSDR